MPARVVRGEINASESLARVSESAELMFRALILAVDDFGRLDARPKILKAALFPMRDAMTTERIGALLSELAAEGCVQVYTADGRPYLALPSWEKHRANGKRAKSSKFPEPPETSAGIRGDPEKSVDPLGIHPSDVGRMTSDDARCRARSARAAAPPEWALGDAERLRQSVRRRWPGAPVPESLTGWARELARIRAMPGDVSALVAWYTDAARDVTPYLPECRSGRSFREKYDAVLAARKRVHPPPAVVKPPPVWRPPPVEGEAVRIQPGMLSSILKHAEAAK